MSSNMVPSSTEGSDVNAGGGVGEDTKPEGSVSEDSDALLLDVTVEKIALIFRQRKLLSRLQTAIPGDIYIPLNKERHEIRLLSLAAAKGRLNPLRGELVTVSLDEKPTFLALSYCWKPGQNDAIIEDSVIDSVPDRSIELCCGGNTMKLSLQRSLDGILRALRRRHGPITIFVDALCINQKDVPEKNIQVPLMSLIYRNASQVLAFLDQGQQVMTEFSGIDFIRSVTKPPFRHLHPDSEMPLPRSLVNVETMVKFKNFLTLSWWNRIWTAQEAILADDLIILHNGRRIPFHQLLKFALIFSHHFTECCKDSRVLSHMLIEDHIQQLLQNITQFGIIAAEKSLDFFNAVTHFRHREATNVLDKVYGLIGLSTSPPSDFVDYNLSVAECYTNFALKWIEHSGTLDVFAHLYNPEDRQRETRWMWPHVDRRADLPSWVPDWTLTFKSTAQRELGARVVTTYCHTASKATKAVIRYSSPGIIWAKGVVFDDVAAVGEAWDDSRYFVAPHIVLGWAELAQAPVFRKLDGVDDQDAEVKRRINMFRNTLSCGIMPNPSSEEPISRPLGQSAVYGALNTGEDFEYILFRMWFSLSLPGHQEVATLAAESTNSSIAPEDFYRILKSKVLPYWNTVAQVTLGRRFVLTKYGTMGFVPKEAAVGDNICILCGGKMAYVYRPGVPHNSLLGDAFVFGAMDGEIVDFALRNRSPDLSPYRWVRFR
jgi:hypothetical protein